MGQKSIGIILFMLCYVVSHGQIVKTDLGRGYNDEEGFFNPDYVSNNNIHQIEVKVYEKPDGSPIHSLNETHHYDFLHDGKLNYHATIRKGPYIGVDTTIVMFAYGPRKRLLAKRKSDAGGFYSSIYFYDPQQRVIKETYYRDQKSGSLFHYVQGQHLEVNSETFKYDTTAFELTKTTYNSAGRPYLEEHFYYDSLRYLKRQTARYVVTHRQQEKRYFYNEKGLISQYQQVDFAGDSTRSLYEYDKVGNLLTEEHYKNGIHTKHVEYVYKPGTMLLDARLSKDLETNSINIVRFKYDFYDQPEQNVQNDQENQD